jgi:DNA (cytosine-5)-methyltransferase 1
MIGLSLFSGIGGLDRAFEAVGGRVVAMCEIDPFCQAVLRKHWPNVPIFDDVKTLRGEDIGAVDIIFGGPPCQPVSLAGRRRGKDDERYLWGDVFRLVADIMPRFCVFENVPGILSIAGDEICKTLVGLGYSVGICMFEAAAVGAPHRRARVFFVAHTRRGMFEGRPVEGTLCGEHGEGAPFDLERPGGAFVSDSEMLLRTQVGGNEQVGILSFVGDAKSGRCRDRIDGENIGASSGENDTSCSTGTSLPDADEQRQLQPQGSLGEFRGRVGNICEAIPDPDMQRREEQRRAVPADGERAELECFECDGGRCPESRMGGVVDGFPAWMDGTCWDREPDIPRVARGVKNRVQRLKALGNAVVPAQAEPIFRVIMEAEAKENDY